MKEENNGIDIYEMADNALQEFVNSKVVEIRSQIFNIRNEEYKCLNCGEETSLEQRWCDSGCRDDYLKMEQRYA